MTIGSIRFLVRTHQNSPDPLDRIRVIAVWARRLKPRCCQRRRQASSRTTIVRWIQKEAIVIAM
jgi:hypothetical protein